MALAVGLLGGSLIMGCVLTGGLILLLIYRSLVGLHEEDQLFLDLADPFSAQVVRNRQGDTATRKPK